MACIEKSIMNLAFFLVAMNSLQRLSLATLQNPPDAVQTSSALNMQLILVRSRQLTVKGGSESEAAKKL